MKSHYDVPLMKNTFLHEGETKRALSRFVLSAKKLSMGEKCLEFENKFAHTQGTKNSILFSSGGAANLAIIQSLVNLGELKKGDKIGFSALTWSTNVFPLLQLGLVPVPVDCDRMTLNVMSYTLEKRLEETKLKAIFVTNALGFCGDLDKIKKICKREKILLLEDNCESLGTKLPSGITGSFGMASSFSFFVGHHMSTIEGGMVITNNEDLSQMLRIVRANGWDRSLNVAQQKAWRSKYRINSEFDAKYTFYDIGFNMKPTEITGFLGLYQLKFLTENLNNRQRNFIQLEKNIFKNNDLLPLDRSHISFLSSFAIPILCKTPLLRRKYLVKFSRNKIEVRPVIAGNIQRQPFYRKYVSVRYKLPETEFIDQCGFYFGNHPEMTDSDLKILSSYLRKNH